MAGAVVSIAQQKGGAGKTTLAIQLGVAWLTMGKRVAMLDIDPQASLFTWFNLRRRRLGDDAGGLVVQGLSGWRLGSELGRLRREFDLVLVDSPPHAETDARGAIRAADLVLLPCQPNALDLWSSKATLDLAQAAGTDALLVLNRVPARGRAADARGGGGVALPRDSARTGGGAACGGRPRSRKRGTRLQREEPAHGPLSAT